VTHSGEDGGMVKVALDGEDGGVVKWHTMEKMVEW